MFDMEVLFVGVTVPPDPYMIVTDFCPNGSLLIYLRQQELDTINQIRVARDIARGMSHLHSAIPGKEVIHRDLAAR